MFFPWWPELTLLFTAWLTFPMASGARLITDWAAPKFAAVMDGNGRALARGGERADERADGSKDAAFAARSSDSAFLWTLFAAPASRLRRALDAVSHKSLRAFAWALTLAGFKRAGATLALALDNTTLPMIGCCVFFFTPSFLTTYGVAVAALALPTASALDALRVADRSGRRRSTRERAKRVNAQLRYWLAYSMIWSLTRASCPGGP